MNLEIVENGFQRTAQGCVNGLANKNGLYLVQASEDSGTAMGAFNKVVALLEADGSAKTK